MPTEPQRLRHLRRIRLNAALLAADEEGRCAYQRALLRDPVVVNLKDPGYQVVGRLRYKHRARMDFTLERMDCLTDNEFKDRYKVGKRTFQNTADKLRPVLEPNHAPAIASSGSPVTTELMLSITLRFLAGTILSRGDFRTSRTSWKDAALCLWG